jgi:hypothetical protein
VLNAQKTKKKAVVAIRILKTRAYINKETVASAAAFIPSMLSDLRVASRFDSYKPKEAKMQCQMKSSAANVTKFQSLTFMEKKSTSERLPDLDPAVTIANTNEKTRAARSYSFSELSRNRRLASCMGERSHIRQLFRHGNPYQNAWNSEDHGIPGVVKSARFCSLRRERRAIFE